MCLWREINTLAFIWYIYCFFCEFICNIWLSYSHLSHYCAYRQNHATPHSKWVWMRRLKATDGSWSAQCNITPTSQSIFRNTWTHKRHCIAFQSGASEQMPTQLELWLLLQWAQYLTLWMMSLLTRLTIHCSPITCCRWVISDICNCRIQFVNLSVYTYVGGESKHVLERVLFYVENLYKINNVFMWSMKQQGCGVLIMPSDERKLKMSCRRVLGPQAQRHHLNGGLDTSSRTFVVLVQRDGILL